MLEAFDNFRYIWDTLDIILVALGIYYLLRIIEKTRAVHMLVGLAFIFVIFVISSYGYLYTLNWILNIFLGSIIIVAVILFQNDIRRALAMVGRNPFFLSAVGRKSEESVIEEIVKATSFMANKKIGALIAIEKDLSLVPFIEIGMRIDAWVSRELIISVFNPSSPMHDGGMIIGRNKVLSTGSFFPLATDLDLERELGTRHRAALGLSNETDAIVVVVSEETGTISLAYQGNLLRGFDATTLESRLMELLKLKRGQSHDYNLLTRLFDIKKQREEKPLT